MHFSKSAIHWLSTFVLLAALPIAQSTTLLNGRFETTTDVQTILDLALDAAEMKETTDIQQKADIYRSGRSSDSEFSLQTLSLSARNTMGHSPMYNIFRHAFLVLGQAEEGEVEGDFDDHPVSHYADTLVNDLFELNMNDIETEAAIVLNVWMAAVYELFEVLDACKTGNSVKAQAHLDRTAAYWVGEGQDTGSNEGGHLLYNVAENAGERFGQDNGESEVNTQLVQGFISIQSDLSGNKCSSEEGYMEIRPKVKDAISWMTVPLVQNLIHHTANLTTEDGSSYVALYALATIPRVASCDAAAYENELDLDVLRQLTPDQSQASIEAIQAAFSCLGITCEQVGSYLDGTVPQCQDKTFVKAAGYSSSSPGAMAKSYLDRDVKEIDIFLRFKANGAAEDWYSYGWNSPDCSLKDLATNQVVPPTVGTSYINLFEDYYGEAGFAHQFFMHAVQLVPPYNTASDDQIRQLATGILKYTVVFMTAASSLQYAVEKCSTNKALSLEYWDTGALLYIGSTEGENSGGSAFGGEFLYSTAKELCVDFGTCTSIPASADENFVAAINEVLMVDLSQGSASIDAKFCDVAQTILETKILPAMAVPLLQGTIKYASFNAGLQVGTTDASLAIGSAFAFSVLPIVNEGATESASILQRQMSFDLTAKPVAGGFSEVANALRIALQSMDTSCTDLGEFVDEPIQGSMCQAPEDSVGSPSVQPVESPGANPTPADPTPGSPTDPDVDTFLPPQGIAFGRYAFQDSDIADGDGSFALDVQGMFEASTIGEAREIYVDGKHAVTKGLSGLKGLVSLSSLSREASRYMIEEPMFNVFRYALYDDEDLEDGSGADFLYADDVVTEALDAGKDRKLAAEGAVVMNVWMMIVHQLYEALRLCRNKSNPIPSIDSAVALWIGKGQGEAKYTNGWMLYSIGQSAAQFYGLDEGEAQVNTDLMVLFNKAQATASMCADSDSAEVEMYHLVNDLVRTLSKPLILTLLFHLVSGSQNMVELYAVSVIPQAYLCSDILGRQLQTDLFSGYSEDDLSDAMMDNVASFLRCQRFTPTDLTHTSSADPKLVALLESLSVRLGFGTQEGDYLSMAGYSPYKNVTETARLDLDVLEITMLMRGRAYKAAEDVYRLGHNAKDPYDPFSYQTLEKIIDSKPQLRDPIFDQYEAYYGEALPFKSMMKHALKKTGSFAAATRGELAEIVFTTLQVMVSFLGVTDRMYLAESVCNHHEKSFTKSHWDEAVALFVGSIEGALSGGDAKTDGTMLYTFGNEICQAFGACEATGESLLNEEMLTYFTAGRDTGKHLNCGHLQRIRTGSLASRLATVLVQGTLAFAIKNMNVVTRDSETLATAHVLAKTVLPLVNAVNSTSAATINNALGDFSTISTGEPVDSLVEAFAYALRGMNIDCEKIGVPIGNPEISLCLANGQVDVDVDVPDETPVPDDITDLADGLYLTTTYVQDRADMALDVADMEQAVGTASYELAKYIYRDGKNSKLYDENGKFASLRSLQDFSTEETLEMFDEPIFNIFLYALQDSDGKFMSRDVRLYADSLVEEAFSTINDDNKVVPVEGAVVLNLWMHITHVLYKALKDCRNNEIYDQDGINSMDIAVAYWIGDGQVAGNGEIGHSLYALSERMGELFQLDEGGQSRTNTNILGLFAEAKHEISLPGACSSNPSSYLRLSRIVNKITSSMAVPLIQALIHSLRSDDRDRVKLYGHAVIPLAAGCSPGVFEYLKDKVLGMNYNMVEVEEIVSYIRQMYACLDLNCSDVGVHLAEVTNEMLGCVDKKLWIFMEGYIPNSDVGEYARLDLDMRQLDILLQMKAYEAAENLYISGKHVQGSNGDSLSLSHLATRSGRTIVPGFATYTKYFDGIFSSPTTYADEIIRSAFPQISGSNVFGVNTELNDDQRRTIILKTAQVMILFYAGLQELYSAFSECQSTASMRAPGNTDGWDRGAALLIGSLYGQVYESGNYGYMYYDLGQEFCIEFGTCRESGAGSHVIEAVTSLLYAGQSALEGSACSELRKAADEISKLLLIPVIQGALSSSIQLSSSHSDKAIQRSEAYVYSRAILPLVDRVDRDAAQIIDSQLGFPGSPSTRSTASQVFAAFARVYPAMQIDCEMIGESHGRDACTGVVYYEGRGLLWIIVGGAGALAAICALALFCRKREEQKLPENNPQFFASDNAELNHSMDLLEKAFAAHSRPRATGRSSETVALTQDMYTDAEAFDDSDADFDEATALTTHSDSSRPDII